MFYITMTYLHISLNNIQMIVNQNYITQTKNLLF